jgi:hypothetical protein
VRKWLNGEKDKHANLVYQTAVATSETVAVIAPAAIRSQRLLLVDDDDGAVLCCVAVPPTGPLKLTPPPVPPQLPEPPDALIVGAPDMNCGRWSKAGQPLTASRQVGGVIGKKKSQKGTNPSNPVDRGAVMYMFN